jgi:uncharacterized paraquat-inducible protein A
MPKLLHAGSPRDETEQRQVRKVTTSRHAPADWVWPAKMIARSWEGARTSTSAAHECRPRVPPREAATCRRCASASKPSTNGEWTGWGSSQAVDVGRG